MNTKRLLMATSVAALLSACESGDINLTPTTIDNSVSTGGGTAPVNPCASYTEAGQTFQGTLNPDNDCVYNALFVSDTKPITVTQVTIPALPDGGLHIFEDSLHIGEDVSATAAATGKRVPQEGEGTTLIIEAGNTLVFRAADSYVRIARGSQIVAEGTADAPITFTADEDALLGAATESDRGLWGGVQINGNGRTNKCSDGTATGSGGVGPSDFDPVPGGSAPHNCHVTAEGRPATYGGNNNAENSGVLRYVVIKHAGFEVVDGNELNALTLNAVGSGTTISHVQTYTTQDDGFEMFGGAVNLDHVVAVNIGDDSIDYSEGYVGDVQYAVVLQTSGSNRCIEADNTGVGLADGITPTTKMRISNLTCIVTNVDTNAGTNPSSKGDAEGVLFREGAHFELYNSLITSNDLGMLSNECFELEDTEGPETLDGAQSGTSIAISNLIACSEAVKPGVINAANAGFNVNVWLAGGDGSAATPTNTNVNNVVVNANLPATLVEGGVGSRGYRTLDLLTDSIGGQLSVPLFDVAGLGGIFETPTYLGGANAGDDWLADWAVGFDSPLVP